MFNRESYYEKENVRIKENYRNSLQKLKEIYDKTEVCYQTGEKKEFYRFFHAAGNLLRKSADGEAKFRDNYFLTKTTEELIKEKNEFYDELLPVNYAHSYANPSYCTEIFGDKWGQLISYCYVLFRKNIAYAYHGKIFKIEEYNRLLIDVFEYVDNNRLEYEILRALITSIERKDKTAEIILTLKERFDRGFTHYKDIVENHDLADLRYLFRYENFITDNEFKTAKHLSTYAADKIERLSKQIVSSYINGFTRNHKDLARKSTVHVVYHLGQERIIRQLIMDLQENNLEVLISHASSTRVNKQYDYDHRFDAALFLDEAYTNLVEKNYRDAFESSKNILADYSGVIDLEKFGEPPFKPEEKKGYLKFTPAQERLLRKYQNNIMRIQEEYLPRSESSFTIVALPAPEIGKDFEQIFDRIFAVNTLEPGKYERIQQIIIDTLDRADYIHVKGNNKTDIVVKMQKIKNPNKETNFMNCGADVNIPVGEVCTSPQLSGTDGVLHLEETYLDGLKYVDLELVFKDGYLVDYNCKNFDNDADNKNYIRENLLFPHKILPLGEFAIGTNTLAYTIAKKFDIIKVLPILIIEKMGPHFAIGDTIYTMEEDKPIFNFLDHKEITARENEKTALRKTDFERAYTHRHTDISLPYDDIEFIAATKENGEKIEIIKNGRFVLAGTEELNKPLDGEFSEA